MSPTAYLVQFRAPRANVGRRFRRVMGTSHGTALEAALKSLRPGALTRYARTRATMAAHVCPADAPKHASGIPHRVHSYELCLSFHPMQSDADEKAQALGFRDADHAREAEERNWLREANPARAAQLEAMEAAR